MLKNAEMKTLKGEYKVIYSNRTHKFILGQFAELISLVKHCEILEGYKDRGSVRTKHLLYSDIHSDTFREVTNTWSRYRKVLVDNGILEVLKNKKGLELYCTGSYEGSEAFAKSYRINPIYNNEENLGVIFTEDEGVENLVLDRLQIDQEKALRCLKVLTAKKNWNDSVVLNMKLKIAVFNITPYTDFVQARTGRQFNKANMLQCNLREYIHWDGEEVAEIDYCAAAISSLFPIINDEEKEDFREFLEGDIYLRIGQIMGIKDRKAIKSAICVWIGSNRSDVYTEKINQFFMEYFPLTFSDWDEESVNTMEYTQGLESHIVCNLMKGKGVSIHDAILCKKKDVEANKQLMIQYMKETTSSDTHEGITIKVKEETKENLHLESIPLFTLSKRAKSKKEIEWEKHEAEIELFLEDQAFRDAS